MKIIDGDKLLKAIKKMDLAYMQQADIIDCLADLINKQVVVSKELNINKEIIMNKELEDLLKFCNDKNLEIHSVNFIKYANTKESVVRYKDGRTRILEYIDGDWE